MTLLIIKVLSIATTFSYLFSLSLNLSGTTEVHMCIGVVLVLVLVLVLVSQLLVDNSDHLLLNLSNVLADVLKISSQASATKVLMLLMDLGLSKGQRETVMVSTRVMVHCGVVQEMLCILLLHLTEVVKHLCYLLFVC